MDIDNHNLVYDMEDYFIEPNELEALEEDAEQDNEQVKGAGE